MGSLERHEEMNRYRLTRLLSQHYDTPMVRVTDAGFCDNSQAAVVLCRECGVLRATLLVEEIDGSMPHSYLAAVRLTPTHELVDNTLFKEYVILSGQCQECGAVIFVRFQRR